LLERFALDQFHRAKALPALFVDPELVHRRDIRVAQRSGSPRFTHEALGCGCAGSCEIGIDDFEGDTALECVVARAIGHTHRSATQFPRRAIFAAFDLICA
jgi:hypothetical protein